MQKQVKEAVKGRQWLDFDRLNNELDRCGKSLQSLEARRKYLAGQYPQAAMPGSFYYYTLQYPPHIRQRLNSLHRCLKKETLALRMASDSLKLYIKESISLTNELMQVIYPQTRGNLYNRLGGLREADISGMLIGAEV
jgi:hypothetical protein